MGVVRISQALNGRDAIALVHDCQRQAGIDPAALNDDGARTALPVITAFFGPGQFETFAQYV